MVMSADEIVSLIKESIPDAKVEIQALKDDGDHFSALVISDKFKNITKVQQHQMVYKALKGKMGEQLHALALKTSSDT
ncbi:MAG: hypothetical protein CFH01_01510 [Alphaproteobacteria bacterium MarineAlpha2_Bin1]|nr:MAG: hypothetical protein CFH01_01510 [Alphaproteobacteria bacterium MarineAlpha2_Bin1]|tara:strand:- start:876 stop:1109 length:234 start_codon:yes stop_codon:yes gene_type:complete